MSRRAPSSGTRIRLAIDPRQLLWESFEEEFFLFNTASGHTHVLNALGATLLRALASGDRSRAELLATLTDTSDDSARAGELVAHLDWLLAQLDELGLVEPVG